MPRYHVAGVTPTGKPIEFDTEDIPDERGAEQAYFAPMLAEKYNFKTIARIPDANTTTPTTSPPAFASGLGTTAPPSMAPTVQGPSESEVSRNRRQMAATGLSVAGASLAPLGGAGLVSRVALGALGGGAGGIGAGYVYPEGGTPRQQGVEGAAFGVAGELLTSILNAGVKGLVKGVGQSLGFTRPKLTAQELQGIDEALALGKQYDVPLSGAGALPPNSPEATRVHSLAARSQGALTRSLGPLQNTRLAQLTEQQIARAGGALDPTSVQFGQEAKLPIATRTLVPLRAKEPVPPNMTPAVRPTPTLPENLPVSAINKSRSILGPERHTEAMMTRNIPATDPADVTAFRSATAKNAAEQGRFAKEAATYERSVYNQRQAELSNAALRGRVKDISQLDIANLNAADLAKKVRGPALRELAASAREIPQLAEPIKRAFWTTTFKDAFAKSKTGNVFNPAALVKNLERLGPENYDVIFGEAAGEARDLLKLARASIEGTELATSGVPSIASRWQILAALLGGAGALMGNIPIGDAGDGTTIPTGTAGKTFLATTALLTAAPVVAAKVLSTPAGMRWYLGAARSVLTSPAPQTAVQTALQGFKSAVLPALHTAERGAIQSGVRLAAGPAEEQPPQ